MSAIIGKRSGYDRLLRKDGLQIGWTVKSVVAFSLYLFVEDIMGKIGNAF